jgi:hypothetical protein
MKLLKAIVALLIVITGLSCNNDVVSVLPPRYEPINSYSKDARILAARLSKDVWIDVSIASEIDSALSLARLSWPSLGSIHALPDFVLDELIIRVTDDVAGKWNAGQFLVDDSYLDSLSRTFYLASIRVLDAQFFSMKFAQSLNIPQLVKLYQRSPHVLSVEADAIATIDGVDNIVAFKKAGVWDIVFSDANGNSLLSTLYYVVATLAPGSASVVDELSYSSPATIYRWNIPATYPAIVFTNVQDMLDHYRSDVWWERRHAVESTWRFFAFTSPWDDADYNNPARWFGMRTDILGRKDEVITLLEAGRADADEDVRASVEFALGKVMSVP